VIGAVDQIPVMTGCLDVWVSVRLTLERIRPTTTSAAAAAASLAG
tara:strand:- start:313 stop:447 length:135 start_codon:yes stop_codon:yes gene_type:complete